MRRRKFIQMSAYGAAAISVPLLKGCAEKPINAAIMQPQFLSHIFDAKTMLETGQAYLKQVTDENNKSKLADLLTSNSSVTSTSDAKSVYAVMNKKVQHDFETNEIVVVDGWILSPTEARQCALLSLMKS